MLNAEFIREIANLATQAESPTVTDVDPVTQMITFKGEKGFRDKPRPREVRYFSNLGSFVLWANEQSTHCAFLDEEQTHRIEIFVSLDRIVATIHDPNQSIGTVAVGLSPQLKLLQSWTTPVWQEQKALLSTLRMQFDGCVTPATVAVFRNLKLVRNEQGEANYQHQRQNLGKNLEAQVTGADAIPETITFTVPVVADPFLGVATCRIKSIVEVDALNGRFCLYVPPQEITIAQRTAEQQLFQMVKDEQLGLFDNIPVYLGSAAGA